MLFQTESTCIIRISIHIDNIIRIHKIIIKFSNKLHYSSHYYSLLFNNFITADGTPVTSKVSTNNVQANSANTTNQQYLIHSSRPNIPLPPQLTIAQLLAIAEDSGVSLSEPCLHLILRQRNKDSKGISSHLIFDIVIVSIKFFIDVNILLKNNN